MRMLVLLFAMLPGVVLALDITTLDGKTYPDCQVSKTYPDSICVLFEGGGARVNFTNLPVTVRSEFGYDPERAATFSKAEAAREERERAVLNAQRVNALARQRAAKAAAATAVAAVPPGGSQLPNQPNTGATYTAVDPATVAGAAGGFGNQAYNNQFGGRGSGAQYVAVRMAGPGGIRGVTVNAPVGPRPPGFPFP